MGIALGVVELTAAQEPPKSPQPNRAQKERHGDQKAKNFHGTYRTLNALSDTVIEEVDIARAAIRGVASPAIAKGTAMML